DDEVIAVVSSTVKKHKDSIEQYDKAGRDDLVQEEKAQLEVALVYLPRQLEAEEIEKEVDGIIADVGASGPSDIGKVMKGIMPKLRGRADGKLVKEIVSRRLS
ncbi:MAG: GatB/YqeY domain-containing protein, partial [candidate division Zixibacteria bacterium]|nr:GatB/YqeY domain-containing protein [candidate division Zixibacteria bacterium]